MWRDSFICETWLIHMCDMTHSYVWHDSFICETWLIHMCDMTHSYVWHDSFICVTWLIHMWDMTHSCVWHDSFICETWLIHMWHDSFMYGTIHSHVTWLIHMWDMTHSYEPRFVQMCQALCTWASGTKLTATHCNTLPHTAGGTCATCWQPRRTR